MKKILVLCTGNSCRSQMMEAVLKHLLDSSLYEVYSAGVEAHGINPYMKRAMVNAGFSIESHTSNTMKEYSHMHFDLVFTVCDHAKDNCPYFQNATETIHHSFNDPANAEGTDEEKMLVYEQVRDEIIAYCKDFVHTLN